MIASGNATNRHLYRRARYQVNEWERVRFDCDAPRALQSEESVVVYAMVQARRKTNPRTGVDVPRRNA